MLEKLVKQSVNFFYKNNIISEEYIEVYEYGLELFITSVMEMLAVIFISIMVGEFIATAIFLVSFGILRIYVGGFHASTNLRCFFTLLLVYSVFLLLLRFADFSAASWTSFFASLLSEILVILFSPVDNANKRLDNTERKKFRKISIIIVSIETVVVFLLLATIKLHYVFLSISCGQLAVALSMLTVKIIEKRSLK